MVAIVEAKYLLCQIAVHVKRFDGNVGPAQSSLEQRPEVLNTLSVNLAVHVFHRVVDDL